MKPIFLILLLFSGYRNTESLINNESLDKIYVQVESIINLLFSIDDSKAINEDVTFYLFTRKTLNSPVQLFLNNTEVLENSDFDPTRKTIFIIHGWTDNKDRKIFLNLINALLTKLDVNIIIVDWRRLAGKIYFHAAENIFPTAQYFASFIQFLSEKGGLNLDDAHLIGHSLGAQISGNVGRILKGKIGRITGLDAAGPLFTFWGSKRNEDHLLDSSDAQFVDIIHTAADDFGVEEPVGHVDFYPNDGIVPQPGCTFIITSVSCSHIRAVEFYTESVNTNNFLSYPCKSWLDRVSGNCNNETNMISMGYWTPKTSRGKYFLTTNSKPPYGRGCCLPWLLWGIIFIYMSTMSTISCKGVL